MSTFTPTGGSATSTGAGNATTPEISHVPLAVADTEYEIVLPNNCKQFELKLLDRIATLKLSYVSGQSGTVYWSVGAGTVFSETGLLLSGVSIFVQSPRVTTLILKTWV